MLRTMDKYGTVGSERRANAIGPCFGFAPISPHHEVDFMTGFDRLGIADRAEYYAIRIRENEH